MKNGHIILGAFGLSLLTTAVDARGAELGMQAPALKIAEWAKGEAVDLSEGKGEKIYVVEFWATWCGPCKTSIPHLSELQKKYKEDNVVIIGVSNETAREVDPFVKQMGEQMTYTVAIDDNNQTSINYMQAFEQNGIPHAFIVNKEGRIAWHGHPMDGLDQTLEKIIDGSYDMEAVAAADREERRLASLLNGYFNSLSEENYSDEAKANGQNLLSEFSGNAQILNGFAWTILTNPAVPHRDLNLATEAAKKAYDLTKGEDADVLDTYARALFDSGKIDEAIEMQKVAVEKSPNAEMRAALERNLSIFIQKRELLK